jgi:hypothetical protein
MRPLVVVFTPEGIEGQLLGGKAGARVCLKLQQVAVEAFMGAVLLRLPGAIRCRPMPSLRKRTASAERPVTPLAANGGPLSLLSASGRPNSLNSLKNTGQACASAVELAACNARQ